MPALQSTWLHVHVTLAMLAYAACALSFALAMMFLIQDKMKTETFLAVTSVSTLAIYAGIVLTRFEKWGGLSLAAWDPEAQIRKFSSRRACACLWSFLTWVGSCSWCSQPWLRRWFSMCSAQSKNESGFLSVANRAVFVSILLQIMTW